MNITLISGRYTKTPEIRYTQAGLCWASFTVAVDNPGKDKGASFIPCKAFGDTAQIIEKYGEKGKMVYVQGHIQTGSYVNKDGKKVYTEDVIVDRIEHTERTQAQPDEVDKQAAIPEGFTEMSDDVPF